MPVPIAGNEWRSETAARHIMEALTSVIVQTRIDMVRRARALAPEDDDGVLSENHIRT
jgi:hypothetical protein